VKAITNLDIGQMPNQEACRKLPILTLLHLARLKGWKARLLDYRNRGDTAGQRGPVVGYSAVAFHGPSQENLGPDDRRQLLELARRSVYDAVTTGGRPQFGTNGFRQALFEPRGCFVTLTKHGQLRGCVGHILPQEPLWEAIADNARDAASRDPRFAPVRRDEVDALEIEISVLTRPQPLPFSSPDDLLAKLQPNKDGVVLQVHGRTATYLPQVWVQIPDKLRFLGGLSEKAGWDASAWRSPGTTVSTYQAESFKEHE
jgi:AmmeMemoRadiSam system protein A